MIETAVCQGLAIELGKDIIVLVGITGGECIDVASYGVKPGDKIAAAQIADDFMRIIVPAGKVTRHEDFRYVPASDYKKKQDDYEAQIAFLLRQLGSIAAKDVGMYGQPVMIAQEAIARLPLITASTPE